MIRPRQRRGHLTAVPLARGWISFAMQHFIPFAAQVSSSPHGEKSLIFIVVQTRIGTSSPQAGEAIDWSACRFDTRLTARGCLRAVQTTSRQSVNLAAA